MTQEQTLVERPGNKAKAWAAVTAGAQLSERSEQKENTMSRLQDHETIEGIEGRIPADFKTSNVQALIWAGDRLRVLDQRVLPHEEMYLECRSALAAVEVIKSMAVRGAPAIGIAGAYGVVLSLQESLRSSHVDWQGKVRDDIECLAMARPTAVNLSWALQRMKQIVTTAMREQLLLEETVEMAVVEAIEIHQEDIQANHTMAELGAQVIARTNADKSQQYRSILTHCNTGSLATGGYGTALGVIRACYAQDLITQVYADESRPWLQGSRLTAWELQRDEIPCQVIADSAAAHTLKHANVGWIVVGADRIAANGDVANKIGTYSLAIAAKYHGVKFMVVAPSSTFDLSLSSGDMIPIEHRDPNELTTWKGDPIAAQGTQANNPVFDVTPAELIDVIVTEKGVIKLPSIERVATIVGS